MIPYPSKTRVSSRNLTEDSTADQKEQLQSKIKFRNIFIKKFL